MTADFRAIRKRLGLSQHQAAAIVGAGHRTIQGWEDGSHKPGPGLAALEYYERLVYAGLATVPERGAHFTE